MRFEALCNGYHGVRVQRRREAAQQRQGSVAGEKIYPDTQPANIFQRWGLTVIDLEGADRVLV
jgi:hypothetical protein